MFWILFVIFIPNIICQREYQTIPLRYDVARKYLQQRQHINFVDHIDEFSSFSLTSERISAYRLQALNNQTTQCERDFNLVLEGLEKREMWAMKTIDAWAKPLPSGLLQGNIYWVGDYDECVKHYYNAANKTFLSQPIETQHCSLTYGAGSSQQSFGASGLTLGLCVPTSCSHSDVILLIHKLFKKANITAGELACSSDPANGQENLTVGAIITITILSVLGFVVLVGTIVERLPALKHYIKSDNASLMNINDDEKDISPLQYTSFNTSQILSESTPILVDSVSPIQAFLAEFSAWKTLRRIFTMKQKVDNESFPFIHGMRVLSLFWVIIGHSLLFGMYYSQNALEALSWMHNAAMQLIQSGEFSVDTFFVLSGFLTTVLFVRHFDKEGRLSVRTMVLYYVHRYIRLTPTYLIIMAISINLTPYFGSGPVYPRQTGFEVPQCRDQYWWTSVAYIGNLYKSDYVCVPVSWYLQNDMQFHWIAPLCLIPFVLKRKPLAFILAFLLVLVSIISTATLLLYYPDLQTSILGGANTVAPDGRTFFNMIYVTPWCRISAYFVGVLTGFFFINTGRSYRLKKSTLIIGHTLAFLNAMVCIFIMYPDSILPNGVGQTWYVLYNSLSRTCWSLTIGWIIFICMNNRNGLVKQILSWPIWLPFSKLNYATYLIHLTIIFIMLLNQRLPFYFQGHLVVNNFVVHIFFSYLTSVLIVVFIETPFFILERKLFKR